jgi:hypothetical protein
LSAFFGARSLDEALAFAGILSLTVILGALARTIAFATIGSHTLDLGGLSRGGASGARSIVLSKGGIGYKHEPDGRR